jgi:hypothetical protein
MRLKGMHVCNLHTFTSDSILLSYAKEGASTQIMVFPRSATANHDA